MQVLHRLSPHRFSGKMLRTAVTCPIVIHLLCITIGFLADPSTASAQTGVPQTNMVPIGPPTGSYPPAGTPSSQFPSTTAPPFSAPNSPAINPSLPNPSVPGQAPPAYSPAPFNPTPPVAGGYGSFDPYASVQSGSNFGAGVNITPIGPPTPVSPGGGVTPGFGITPSFGGLFSSPASAPLNAPIISSPPPGGPVYGTYDNANVYGYPAPNYPDNIYPSSSPTTLFPNGIVASSTIFGSDLNQYSAYRLLQGPRFRHTYVGSGSGVSDLNTNDTDLSLVFAFQNFCFSNQPLYVIPSFSLHLWDGPNSSTGADLPSKAYSGFIDFGWNSNPNQIFSTELGVRVGAFSDFDTSNSDTVRVLGKALAIFRLTPQTTLKGGVYYLDRNSIKLVPAFGFLCRPNPFTQVDLFFPQPKFSRYCQTVGTHDLWWYIAGDYGGGSWTIQRDLGKGDDSVDINEYRLLAGIEWGRSDAIRAGRRTGFFDIGWAFNREIEYRYNPQDNLDLRDGMVFRIGIGY